LENIQEIKKMVEQIPPPPLWRSKRYFVVFLAFLGYVNLYALRVNLSVAIVAMTDKTAINGTEMIFDWNQESKGIILGSFFYGYIITQFIGGYAATKIGGNIVFGVGIAITALFCLVTPWIVRYADIAGIIIVRVIQGIASGLSFPSCHALFAKWAPQNERSRMVSFALSGYLFGTVLANMCAGLLAVSYGWPAIFYVFGAAGLIWYAIWAVIVRKSPEYDKFMTKAEKLYIMSNSGSAPQNQPNPPWGKLFTSLPVYAIAVAQFSSNWGFYTLLTQLPSYLNDTLNFKLKATGFMSALPYLTLGILLPISGYIADFLKFRNILTLTQIRKSFTSISFLIQGSFLVIVAFLSDPIWCVVFVILSVGSGAFSLTGFLVNPLDIAPQYAGIIVGTTNTFSTIPGIISPYITGLIVATSHVLEWRTVFFISATIYFVGAIFYWIFASGEVQPWAIQNHQKIDELTKANSEEESECDTGI
jgi:ACS family sodium-dependent inorganic phosphate cotransporter